VTSPPYWGLRDYGVNGQLGLERTPEEYVANMVRVFREVRRVLRDDGVLWLNLGDSYAGSWSGNSMRPEGGTQREGNPGFQALDDRVPKRGGFVPAGLKPKDLVGIPWRVAFALQADGWWLRSDVVWAKSNPMPESVTDRPTKAHEYVFLLSKSERYFYDADAIADASVYPGDMRHLRTDTRKTIDPFCADNGSRSRTGNATGSTRNARSVWEIPTKPYPEAHFATFPPELASRCIKAGTSQRGCCVECGAPWERIAEREKVEQTGVTPKQQAYRNQGLASNKSTIGRTKAWGVDEGRRTTLRWQPTCDHDTEPIPCTVIDPFGGSGTTAATATGLGRKAIHIDLNPDYLELARNRIGPMLCARCV